MSNYTKATNFTAKDTLPTGNSGKIVKGTEIDTELTAIASAISSKADLNSPALTGTPTAPTASANTNTTQVATTAFVRGEITALGSIGTMAAQNANAVAITGGTITGLSSALPVASGGTGETGATGTGSIVKTSSPTLTTPTIAAIKSASTGTATVFRDSAGTEIGQLCKAWVNFNSSSGSAVIRASFNVSSVTYNTAGDYTVNFTTAMTDANYAAFASASPEYNNTPGGLIAMHCGVSNLTQQDPTTTGFRFSVMRPSGQPHNSTYVLASVFR